MLAATRGRVGLQGLRKFAVTRCSDQVEGLESSVAARLCTVSFSALLMRKRQGLCGFVTEML